MNLARLVKKRFSLKTRNICLYPIVLALTGCGPVHGVWYHASAPIGYASNSECLRVGKNDEWVLKRQGVTIYVRVSLPTAGYAGAIGVNLHVPAGLAVDSEIKNFLARDRAGNKLAGNFTVYTSNYIDGSYVNTALSSNVHYLSGSKFATKHKPFTDYFFGLTGLDALPTSFDVFLPRMEINGHAYPPLTIHFEKKPGWYWLEGINC
ncbi:MAG: hypothetical protein ACRES7_10940 [Gammaproteobacteria bacterium]